MKASPGKEISCLHLVLGSGHDALESCITQCEPGDAVVFIDQGVMHLLQGEAALGRLGQQLVFFLAADLNARGLMPAAEYAELGILEDAGFPDLLRRFDHCLSWK